METHVRTWRVAARARLKQERQELSATDRRFLTEAIARNLDRVFERLTCGTLGIYWPIKGEFDIRAWAAGISARKRCRLALPVVIREHAPLEYWRWHSGDEMVRGFWGIMVPKTPVAVAPDVVIAPLLGFSDLYRLGYGGGYFDRTLAVLQPKPKAIGIGAESGRMQGFVPQSHDIPMDVIVTEAGVYRGPTMAEGSHEHQ